MEQRLAEYKRRKRREQRLNSVKHRIINMFSARTEEDERILITTLSEDQCIDEDNETNDPSCPPPLSEVKEEKKTALTYFLYVLCILCWSTVYVIAIKLAFGMVYLLLSSLIGIYLNTRTSPKKIGEVSAYSVFNKDCHSIDGTLKAEQFEREIRYGASSVR